MDPITSAALSTVIVPLASGAAGEAGKQAWATLTTFVKARLGRESPPAAAIEQIDQTADPGYADELAGHLHRLSNDDPQAAQWLATWLNSASALVHQTTHVSNVIGGQAQVHGPVVQGHTFSGLTFTTPPAPQTPDPR